MANANNQNVAVHSGTRRSEAKSNPYNKRQAEFVKREENMPDQFPGMHCVIVPKINPRDPRAGSPVSEYLGLGYKKLSEDPDVTGHGDEIIMGIDLDTYLKREEARASELKQSTTALIKGMGEGMDLGNGVSYRPEMSEAVELDPIEVSGSSKPDAED
jgi:hypothetical protein